MASYGKTILFFNSDSSTSNATISLANTATSLSGSEYGSLDVLISVSAFSSPGGGSVRYAVQEQISDAGYITTAYSGTINAVGNYWLSHFPMNSAQLTGTTVGWGSFAALGTGYDKRLTSVWVGTATSINSTIYFVMNSKTSS